MRNYHFPVNKNRGKIIALVGPDGAGKTTICKGLEEKMKIDGRKSKYMYGSKHSNHILFLAKISFNFYTLLKDLPVIGNILGMFYLFIIHYPIEYIDNLLKYRRAKKLSINEYFVIFDRYPVDRILPITKTFTRQFLKEEKSNFKYIVKLFIWGIMFFYSIIYFKCYPKPDILFFLDSDEKILQERKESYYKDKSDASNARQMYLELMKVTKGNKAVSIMIKSDRTIQTVLNDVYRVIKDDGVNLENVKL